MRDLRYPRSQQDVIDSLEVVLSIMGHGPEYNILSMYKKQQLPETVLPGILDMFGEVEQKAIDLGIGGLASHDIRVEAVRLCGFPILTTKFMDAMVDSIQYLTGKERPAVLDPMAGTGAMAKSLNDRKIFTRASDLFIDREMFDGYRNQWMPVLEMDAMAALEDYAVDSTDLVLLSWPDYESTVASDVMKWLADHKPEMPVIYIGEPCGGCTADDEFFDLIEIIDVPSEHDCNKFYQHYLMNLEKY